MRHVLIIAAVAEGATGLALLVVPSLVGQLLLGVELSGAAVTVTQLAGIAVMALALACWPGTPRLAMLIYSAAVALYFAYAGISGAASGPLLWPAVIAHVILTALLIRSMRPRT